MFAAIEQLFEIIKPKRLLFIAIDGVVSLHVQCSETNIDTGTSSKDEPATSASVQSRQGTGTAQRRPQPLTTMPGSKGASGTERS